MPVPFLIRELDDDTHRELKITAAQEQKSMDQLIKEAIKEYLEKRKESRKRK